MTRKKQPVEVLPLRRIAIVQSKDLWSYDCEEHFKIIEKVTEFTEVDFQTYELLKKASIRYGFIVVEQPINQEAFIKKTVSDWLKFVAAEEKAAAEAQAKAEAKRLERKAKAEAKKRQQELDSIEAQRQVYEELKKKFENETTS